MLRAGSTLVALGMALAGCAGSPSSISPVATTSAGSPSAAGSVEASGTSEAIVGMWQGIHECEGIAEALADGGFDEAVIAETIVGNGLLPGVGSPDEVTDIAAACEGATPLEHSHEFTADGQFFSYDQDGEEVDFGHTSSLTRTRLVIGAPDRPDVTFEFVIADDHLTLEPQLQAGCLEFECQWAVMVAMPWSGMDRVEE